MSRVFIISAPSGSGKSTLVQRLLASDPGLVFSISHTTRAPRGQERNGADYHFVSRDEFLAMRERGEFLECAEVFGNWYGTHGSILDQAAAAGRDVVLDIDVQGARQLRDRVPEAVSIFILAPSRAELAKRLRGRSEDDERVIQRRLSEAAREIRDYRQYDYVLVNEDVERSAAILSAIVVAERHRRASSAVEARVQSILATFAADGAGSVREVS
jgi:guanylate kinase